MAGRLPVFLPIGSDILLLPYLRSEFYTKRSNLQRRVEKGSALQSQSSFNIISYHIFYTPGLGWFLHTIHWHRHHHHPDVVSTRLFISLVERSRTWVIKLFIFGQNILKLFIVNGALLSRKYSRHYGLGYLGPNTIAILYI